MHFPFFFILNSFWKSTVRGQFFQGELSSLDNEKGGAAGIILLAGTTQGPTMHQPFYPLNSECLHKNVEQYLSHTHTSPYRILIYTHVPGFNI